MIIGQRGLETYPLPLAIVLHFDVELVRGDNRSSLYGFRVGRGTHLYGNKVT